MVVVCYMGGTCGDLITALIDPTGARLTHTTVTHLPDRTRLKKPHLFLDNEEKKLYLESVTYASISSHDLDYHRRMCHDFLGIKVMTLDTALWAAERFQKLHRPQVWQEMQISCGAATLKDYAQTMIDYGNMIAEITDKIITLEDIVSGRAVDILRSHLKIPITADAEIFYSQWLRAQEI